MFQNACLYIVWKLTRNLLGLIYIYIYVFLLWRCDPTRVMASSFLMFLDHTQQRTTVGRTPLDEWSARTQRPLPDNTQHSQQTNIHVPGKIRTHNLSRRSALNLRLRPRGHWDRHKEYYKNQLTQRIPSYWQESLVLLTLRRRTTYIYVALWRSLTLRRLMSYIYGAPILDVSRSHTTTQHSR